MITKVDMSLFPDSAIKAIRHEYEMAKRNKEMFRYYPKVVSANEAVMSVLKRLFGSEFFRDIG